MEKSGASKPKTNFIEEKFLPAAAKIGNQRHLIALRDGIVMVMPLLILGAFAMIIAEFPSQAYLDFMAGTFGSTGQPTPTSSPASPPRMRATTA